MSITALFTRVFMLHGKTAHLVLPDTALSGAPRALCRARPYLGRSWFGTGGQAEYEKAAALPVCGKCRAAAEGGAG